MSVLVKHLHAAGRVAARLTLHGDEGDGMVGRDVGEREFGQRALRLTVDEDLRHGHQVAAACVAASLHDPAVDHVVVGGIDENLRLFLLAHEFGHIAAQDIHRLAEAYKPYVPGDVVQEVTDKMSVGALREIANVAKSHEFEADAFGVRALVKLGLSFEDAKAAAIEAVMKYPEMETGTHPASFKRRMALIQLSE